MAGVPKWKKEQEKRLMPAPKFTKEEEKYRDYCNKAGIIISPVATDDNQVGKWHVGISTPDNFKKVYKSPEICDKHSIWEVYIKYCKYYYDKQTKMGS